MKGFWRIGRWVRRGQSQEPLHGSPVTVEEPGVCVSCGCFMVEIRWSECTVASIGGEWMSAAGCGDGPRDLISIDTGKGM